VDHEIVDVDYREPTGLEGEKQYHVQCKPEDINPIVFVPGSQNRVKKIADELDDAKTVQKNRGLITVNGHYEGRPFTITSTGMGGPAAAIVYEELINLGAEVLIRIGSMAGMQDYVQEGDLVIPYGAVRDDGATQYYVPEKYPAVPSPEVFQSLTGVARNLEADFHTGINWTHSAFYSRSPDYFKGWANKGVVSLEMEAATLFVISQLRDVRSGVIGTCFANRKKQSSGEDVDLSVPSADSEAVQQGVVSSIKVALDAGRKLYEKLELT